MPLSACRILVPDYAFNCIVHFNDERYFLEMPWTRLLVPERLPFPSGLTTLSLVVVPDMQRDGIIWSSYLWPIQEVFTLIN